MKVLFELTFFMELHKR